MLSRNDKIFFGEEIFEDCEIVVKEFVGRDGKLYFGALISSKVSKLPERYQDIKTSVVRNMIEYGDINGYQYTFALTFVSQVFTLWCMEGDPKKIFENYLTFPHVQNWCRRRSCSNWLT